MRSKPVCSSQEIPRISWNPNVHYSTHKCPPPVPILSQLDLVSTPTSHFLKIHLNIISLSMPVSPKWSLSLRFPHQILVCTSPLPKRSTCPAHLTLLDFITRKILGEQYSSLSSSLCSFLHYPFYLVSLRLICSPQHSILKHAQPMLLLHYKRPSITPIQNNRKNYIYVYLKEGTKFLQKVSAIFLTLFIKNFKSKLPHFSI